MDKKFKTEIVSQLLTSINCFYEYPALSPGQVDMMLKDIHIATATNKLKRATAARDWSITSDDPASADLAQEITNRFSDLKFNDIIKYFNNVRYHGYGAFEIIYNNDFSLKQLVPIPQKFLTWDIFKKVWKLQGMSRTIYLDDPDKWLIVTNEGGITNPHGVSVLEPCIPSYTDARSIRSKMRSIAEKYGDIITVFAVTKDMSTKEVGEAAEDVKKLKGGDGTKGSVLTVPLTGDYSLKDSYHFIKLDDLKTEIHQQLEDRFKGEITKYILGADYSDSASSTGSNARDQVQQKEQEKVEEEICKFIRDSFQSLIELDAKLHGYNSKMFYLKLEKERDLQAESALKKSESETFRTASQGISALSISGYELTPRAVAKLTGIALEDITLKAPTTSEFQKKEPKKKRNIVEEKKKYNLSRMKLFKDRNEESLKLFSKKVAPQIKKALQGAKTPHDLAKIDLDLTFLEEHYILAQLNGMMDEEDIARLTYEFDAALNPYNLKFSQAISWFLSKKPELSENVEELTQEAREKFHIIKKSVDVEVTKKLIDNLAIALKKKESFEEWKKRSTEILKVSGFADDGWYLANVYRTNMITSYSVGRYQQQEAMKDLFAYRLYDSVMDGLTSAICQTLDNKIYKATDSIWLRIYPPNHYQCRSGVICLTKEEFLEGGYSLGKDPGEVFYKNLKSFDGNPGEAWKNIQKQTKKKEKYIQMKLQGM